MFSGDKALKLIPQGSVYRQGHVQAERASAPELGDLCLGPGSGCDSEQIPPPLWASVPHLSDGGGGLRSLWVFLFCRCGFSREGLLNEFSCTYLGTSRCLIQVGCTGGLGTSPPKEDGREK